MPGAKVTKARDTSFLPFWCSHSSRAYSPTEEPEETHVGAGEVLGCRAMTGVFQDQKAQIGIRTLRFRNAVGDGSQENIFKELS